MGGDNTEFAVKGKSKKGGKKGALSKGKGTSAAPVHEKNLANAAELSTVNVEQENHKGLKGKGKSKMVETGDHDKDLNMKGCKGKATFPEKGGAKGKEKGENVPVEKGTMAKGKEKGEKGKEKGAMAKGEKGKEKGTMAKGKEKGEKGTVEKGKEKGTMAKGEKGKEKGTMAKGKEKGEKGTVAKGKEKGMMVKGKEKGEKGEKGKEKGNTALEKENDNTEKGPKENGKGKEKGKEKGKGKATEMKTGKGKTKNDEEASGSKSKAGFWAWVPDDQFPSTYESQREWGRKSSWWSWSYSAHSYNEIHECSDDSCSDSDTYDDEPNEVIELNSSSSEDRDESTPPHKKARTGDDREGWYERHGVWVPRDGSHRFPPFDCWSSD